MLQYLIYAGNNLKILEEKKDDWKGKFRMVFADPPYFLSSYRSKEHQASTVFRKKGIKLYKGGWDEIPEKYNDRPYDYIIKHSLRWLKIVKNVMTEDGTIFICGLGQFNIYGVVYALLKLDYWILNNIYIYKHNSPPNLRAVRLAACVEEMIWAKKTEESPYLFNYKRMKRYNGGKQMRNMWSMNMVQYKFPSYMSNKEIHTTIKPDEQIKRSIMMATKKGIGYWTLFWVLVLL